MVVGGAVVGILLLVFKAYPAWSEWRLEARRVAMQRIERAQLVSTTVSGFSLRLDSLEARSKRLVQLRSAFVAGDSTSEAPSVLRAIMTEAAAAAMIRVDTITARLTTPSLEAPRRVELELKGVGDIAGVAALLRRVETGSPMLAVRRLRVRAHDVASSADEPELLAIYLVVEGAVLETRDSLP
jgi:hypothetical protein